MRSKIDRLINLPFDPDAATVCRLAPEATAALAAYSAKLGKWADAEGDDQTASIASKATATVCRLALLIEALKWAETSTTDTPPAFVSLESMNAAIRLNEYFRACALRVSPRMKATATAAEKLDGPKRDWFERLPEEFETKTAVEIALTVGLAERSAKKYLNEKNLFDKKGHGQYLKK